MSLFYLPCIEKLLYSRVKITNLFSYALRHNDAKNITPPLLPTPRRLRHSRFSTKSIVFREKKLIKKANWIFEELSSL